MDIKNTIHTLFEKQVMDFPDRIAMICDTQSFTYNELNRKANQLAHYLIKCGLKPDTPVALCLERSPDFIISILAVLKAGGAYLPMDPKQPEERLSFLLQDSQAPVLITKAPLKGDTRTLILLNQDEANINKQPDFNPHIEVHPKHLAYVIYTSGSTGNPKGVLIEHCSVVNYCQWFAQYSDCQHQQRIDFSSSPIFDMAVSTSIVPLMLGLTLILCEDSVKKQAANYLNHLAKSRINTIKLTPSYFKVLLEEVQNHFIPLPHLRSIILGGEHLSAAECKSWLALYPKHVLFNEYGPTEASVAVSSYKVCAKNINDLGNHVPIGKAGTQMSCHILDANNLPVPDGEAGELFIGGICLARGYLNQPELTQKQFIQTTENIRLYKTGDWCKKSADGILEYLGRIDDQVKIRGFRIEPGEIEIQLKKHSAIKEALILAQKDTLNELRLVAYYISKNSFSAPNPKQIRQYLQKYLPDHMIPSVFVSLDSFPLTANGKLNKAALPVPQLKRSLNYVEPSTAWEKKLAAIWSEELGLPFIGLYDDFFDLGGHSLSAARIVSKINNLLRRSISLHDFYQAANIATLVPIIKKTKKTAKKKLKPEYRKITQIPLSDFQFLLWLANIFEPRAKKLNIVARKRLLGYLDKAALEFAFQAILKKHEALLYQVLTFQPIQQIQKNYSFNLMEYHIESLSKQESETILQQSIAELINFNPWPKNRPLIRAQLFYLRENESELQICLPHLISDDDCIDILFSDLSKYYLDYTKIQTIETDIHYKEYVLNERHSIEINLDKDMLFWKEYLKDSCLFSFPPEHVVNNMDAKQLSYSTYSLIPEHALNNLQHYCKQNHISINNALCAALALALRNCSGNHQSEASDILINRVQSTRDDSVYDHTVGCFLRVEPIKISLNKTSTLSHLSQQIRQSIIDTSNHQQCSNLVKLSSVSTFKPKGKSIVNFLLPLFTPVYTRILKIPPAYSTILQRCASRILAFKRNNKFLINLNIRSNFMSTPFQKLELFGLNTQPITNQQDDLLAIDYIFEVCFIHDERQNTRHLVISANLKPEFRQLIAQEVIQIMSSISSEKNTAQESYALENTEIS